MREKKAKERTHRPHGRRNDSADLEEVLDDGGKHGEDVGSDEEGGSRVKEGSGARVIVDE